ncbi:MAG: hypothetical protein AAF696_08455 [Bacteroidota bacterium]
MKYFSTYARFLAALILGTFISSCSLIDQSDKIIAPQWEPDFAIPLVNTEYSTADLLARMDSNSYIQTDANGLLTFVFDRDIDPVSTGSIIEFPNMPVPMFDTTQAVGFPISGIELLGIKEGLLNYSFESIDIGNQELVVQIPEATLNGAPFEAVVPFTAPGTFAGTLNLAAYELDLSAERLTFKYFARARGTNERNALLNFLFEITDLEYRQINGYLGTQNLEMGADSLELTAFDDLISGELRLNDPRISINVANRYGVPVQVKANSFEVQTESGSLALQHTGLQNGLPIAYPDLNEVGQASNTLIEINKDNSNLADLLSAQPTGIKYDLEATLYPEGDSSQRGFVLDDSDFDLGLHIEIPMDLQLSDIQIEQDLELELTSMDEVEEASLTLITENGFPLDLKVQLYFLDRQGVVQDSLFDSFAQLLSAAPVDANGKVSQISESTVEIELNADRWYRLQNSAEIRVKAEIATTSGGTVPVKFYEDYKLQIKLGALAKLNP